MRDTIPELARRSTSDPATALGSAPKSSGGLSTGIVETHDNGFAIVGNGPDGHGMGLADIGPRLIKTDSDGNIQWQRQFGSIFQQVALDIQLTQDGGFVLGGSDAGTRGFDPYLIKTDPLGCTE